MSDAARLARVRRVIAAGARIADPMDALGVEARARLPAASGLSTQGVELALGEHLEVAPSDEALRALLASCGEAPRCHLVLSANVCTAPLRALALAAATAPSVAVRPSRRDPVVADLLVRALQDDAQARAAPLEIEKVAEVAPGGGDELHVYGSDETIAAFRRRAVGTQRGGAVVLRGHGTGIGVALIEADAEVERVAAALARDVVPFDQQGCLSPRFALVAGGPARAETFAAALAAHLGALGQRVPRGPLDEAQRAALAAWADTFRAVGEVDVGEHHLVAVDGAPRALLLPPAARAVCVAAAEPADVARLLVAYAPHVAATGVAGLPTAALGPTPRASAEPALDAVEGTLARALRSIAPRARWSPLGSMQRPALDGPVDLRTVRETI
ncbi:MAG: acyl-CoA reductase [Polyangiaceae bacterium]